MSTGLAGAWGTQEILVPRELILRTVAEASKVSFENFGIPSHWVLSQWPRDSSFPVRLRTPENPVSCGRAAEPEITKSFGPLGGRTPSSPMTLARLLKVQ